MSARTLIPSSQLYTLYKWDPDLKIQSLSGKGSGKGDTITASNDEYIIVKDHINREVEVKYIMNNGEITIKEIYDKVKEYTYDITIQQVSWIERNCKLGNPDWRSIRVEYESKAPHPQLFKSLVQDGSFPLQDLTDILESMKESINLPPEIVKRIRSCLVLSKTEPEIRYDPDAINALRKPYMIFMLDTSKYWRLFDLDYKKRGGP